MNHIMQSRKVIKVITTVLIFCCSLFLFYGCEEPHDVDLSDNKRLIEQLRHDAGVDSEIIEFTADTLVQCVSLSWMYSIDVKVDSIGIYLNGVLYDKVEIDNDADITYSESLLSGVSVGNNSEEISAALEKIKNSKHCYILKTTSGTPQAKIAIYDIDDVYYFISFTDTDEVLRIHYANMKA